MRLTFINSYNSSPTFDFVRSENIRLALIFECLQPTSFPIKIFTWGITDLIFMKFIFLSIHLSHLFDTLLEFSI